MRISQLIEGLAIAFVIIGIGQMIDQAQHQQEQPKVEHIHSRA